MWPYFPLAIGTALFLMLVARPISVYLAFAPFKVSRKKSAFVSWIGLRGATPIVFSLVPLTAKVRHSDLIFNAVFIIVILSVLFQGTTMKWLAAKLRLLEEDNQIQPSSQ
jgi:potassium/hydrogen antiporter